VSEVNSIDHDTSEILRKSRAEVVAEVVAEGACMHVPKPDPTLIVTIAVTNENCYRMNPVRRGRVDNVYLTPPRLFHGSKPLIEKFRGMTVWDGSNGLEVSPTFWWVKDLVWLFRIRMCMMELSNRK
jgi:hypothetical protein